jgi:uncharacterized membrane protein
LSHHGSKFKDDFVNYFAASIFLYLSHAVPSAPRARRFIFEALGPVRFRVFYSILSSLAGIWFVWAYATTNVGGFVYKPLPGAAALATLLMPVALFLIVARLTSPFGEISCPNSPVGIYRVTRFPGSLGILLWSVLHLAATGDTKRVMAFGIFGLIAVTALIKNEVVLKRQVGEEALRFRAETSLLPFRAKQGLGGWIEGLGEVGLKTPVIVILAYVLLIALHPLILGVEPLSWILG